MAHHNALVFRKTGEGDELTVLQLLQGLVGIGHFLMAVLSRVPVAGEVLEHRHNALFLQTLGHGLCHLACNIAIGGEGAVANHRIVGVGIHVRHRGKVHIKAVFPKVGTDGLPHFQGILRISRSPHRPGTFVLGKVKGGVVGKTGNGAALLVNPQKQRDFCRPLQKGIVGGNLLRAVKVGGKLDDSPHRVFCKNLPDGIFHLGQLLLGQGLHGGFDLGKAQSARGHHEQLPHFFLQGHGLQLQNQGVRLCGGFGGFRLGRGFRGGFRGSFRGFRGCGRAAPKQGEKQCGEGQQFFHGSASFGKM